MYGIKYTLLGRQEVYLTRKKNGEYKISESKKDIAEFDDEYDAIFAAVETAKKIYGRQKEFTLLWHA